VTELAGRGTAIGGRVIELAGRATEIGGRATEIGGRALEMSGRLRDEQATLSKRIAPRSLLIHASNHLENLRREHREQRQMISLVAALENADEMWKSCGHDVGELSPTVRVAYLIGQLDFEVTLGGVLGWLSNSSGAHGVETAEALELIGAHKCAAIIRKILAFFPGGALETDDGARIRKIQEALPTAQTEWRELGNKLLTWPDDVSGLLTLYVSEHEDDFRKTTSR
jgi:hypothetical protein